MVPPLTLFYYMKKGPNLRWSLIQCSGGDEGDRTPDLLTASQALSQLSYAPVQRSTIRELPRRCKDNFGKTFGGGIARSRPRAPGSEQGTHLTTNFQPITQDVGPKLRFRSPLSLCFAPIAQTQARAKTLHDRIKLLSIIEHVVRNQKNVISHALQRCHAFGIVVEHGARTMDNLSLKLHDARLHYDRVHDHDVPIADFLPCNALRRWAKRRKVVDVNVSKAGTAARARNR